MLRLRLGYLVIRATLLEVAGWMILLPGLIGIFTRTIKLGEALSLMGLGILLMQDRYYVRWVIRRKQRRLERLMEAAQRQQAPNAPGESP
jgi:hypothetical protein